MDDDLIVANVKNRENSKDTSMMGHVLTLLKKAMNIHRDQVKSRKKQSITDLKILRVLTVKDPSKKPANGCVAIDKVINFDPSSPNPKPKASNFMSVLMNPLGGSPFDTGSKIKENSEEGSSDDLGREIRKSLLVNDTPDVMPILIERKKSVKPKPTVGTQSQSPKHSVPI